MQIKDKVTIITGAGAGIGKATALLLAEKGAKVLCNDISDSALSTVKQIKTQGDEAFFVQGDVSIPEIAQNIINKAIETYHQIDILFNNAGIVIPGRADNTSVETWDRIMAVNVRSVFLMSKFALPYLIKSRGCIINNSSCVALKGTKNRLAYSASKGAILSMTRAMATDYVEAGVRINAICPGVVDSPSFRQRVANSDDPEAAMANFIAMQPLGRISTAQEIAEGVFYLVRSEYCVGSCLSIDGGITM